MKTQFNSDLNHKVHKIKRNLDINEYGCVDLDIVKQKLPKLTCGSIHLSMAFSGFIYKLDNDESIIVVNGVYNKLDQRFAFAHELYHFFFSNVGKIICPKPNEKIERNPEEIRADLFASKFLLPDIDMRDYIESDFNGVVDEKTIVGIMEKYLVPLYTVLIRLKYDEFFENDDQFDLFSKICQPLINESQILKPYLTKDYDCKPTIEGYYITLCEKAYKENRISYQKYKELMEDGFALNKLVGEMDG